PAFPPGAPLGLPVPAKPPFTFATWLESAPVKALLPIPLLLILAPGVWWFFRATWRELDHEAQLFRGRLLAQGRYDLRPAALFVIAAIVLTMQEYYGGRSTYDEFVRPWLLQEEAIHHHARIKLFKYDELYGYAWWAFCRIVGYVFVPFTAYKIL